MKAHFKFAFQRTIPMLVGFLPLGIAYGVLMNDAGYNFLWSGLTSIIVLAGSLQFLMVSFFAGGIPLITIIVMSLLLNSRHIFYGLALIEKFREFGRWKYFLIWGLSDEAFSLICSYVPRPELKERTVHVMSTFLVCFYWVLFTAVGGLLGELITFDTTGIDFALTCLFTVILVDQMRAAKSKVPAYIALASGVLCILIFGAANFILPSLIITVMALLLLRGRLEPVVMETAEVPPAVEPHRTDSADAGNGRGAE